MAGSRSRWKALEAFHPAGLQQLPDGAYVIHTIAFSWAGHKNGVGMEYQTRMCMKPCSNH
jgi:hypothetical protein